MTGYENERSHGVVGNGAVNSSRAFEALRFLVVKKKRVCNACVLSELLYDSECRVPIRKYLKMMNSVHNTRVGIVLGISNYQQCNSSYRQLLYGISKGYGYCGDKPDEVPSGEAGTFLQKSGPQAPQVVPFYYIGEDYPLWRSKEELKKCCKKDWKALLLCGVNMLWYRGGGRVEHPRVID